MRLARVHLLKLVAEEDLGVIGQLLRPFGDEAVDGLRPVQDGDVLPHVKACVGKHVHDLPLPGGVPVEEDAGRYLAGKGIDLVAAVAEEHPGGYVPADFIQIDGDPEGQADQAVLQVPLDGDGHRFIEGRKGLVQEDGRVRAGEGIGDFPAPKVPPDGGQQLALVAVDPDHLAPERDIAEVLRQAEQGAGHTDHGAELLEGAAQAAEDRQLFFRDALLRGRVLPDFQQKGEGLQLFQHQVGIAVQRQGFAAPDRQMVRRLLFAVEGIQVVQQLLDFFVKAHAGWFQGKAVAEHGGRFLVPVPQKPEHLAHHVQPVLPCAQGQGKAVLHMRQRDFQPDGLFFPQDVGGKHGQGIDIF